MAGSRFSKNRFPLALTIAPFVLLASCKSNGPGQSNVPYVLPASVTLPVTLTPQELDYWCWAASGEMVMAYLGQNVQQCAEANDFLHHTDCCPTSGASDSCDSGGWPQFDKHQITFLQTTNTAVSLAELQRQLGLRRMPIVFSWKYVGGGGHMMVAVGYGSVGGTPMVEVDDPWAPNVGNHRFITYDEFVSAPNDHDHWNDFYNFAKAGS